MCRYDLQSLMNRDFTVVNTSGIKYKFRVCGALTDNACRIETGAVYFLSIAYNYHYMMNLNFSSNYYSYIQEYAIQNTIHHWAKLTQI